MREGPSVLECPFCAARFSPGEAQSGCGPCGGCKGFWGGFKKPCALACPRCGYAVFGGEGGGNNPSLEASAEGVASPSPSGARPLGQCPLGQPARVVALEADESSLRKLLTLGILPGVQLEVERKKPCYVCKVGRARLALDERLAACVRVVFPPPGGQGGERKAAPPEGALL